MTSNMRAALLLFFKDNESEYILGFCSTPDLFPEREIVSACQKYFNLKYNEAKACLKLMKDKKDIIYKEILYFFFKEKNDDN